MHIRQYGACMYAMGYNSLLLNAGDNKEDGKMKNATKFDAHYLMRKKKILHSK